jgi:hypothetical protein
MKQFKYGDRAYFLSASSLFILLRPSRIGIGSESVNQRFFTWYIHHVSAFGVFPISLGV